MGRDEEGDALVEQIAAENPYDDSTLQVMTYCYKEREECTVISLVSLIDFVIVFIDDLIVQIHSRQNLHVVQ